MQQHARRCLVEEKYPLGWVDVQKHVWRQMEFAQLLKVKHSSDSCFSAGISTSYVYTCYLLLSIPVAGLAPCFLSAWRHTFSHSFWQAICILPVWDSPRDWDLKYSSKKCLTVLVQIHTLRMASFYCSSVLGVFLFSNFSLWHLAHFHGSD